MMQAVFYNMIILLGLVVPILICIAMTTVIERKVMGSIQRRIGPNTTGYQGIGQAIADGLKLSLKQLIITNDIDIYFWLLASVLSFSISLFMWVIIPIPEEVLNIKNNLIVILALSSLSVYAILLCGWSVDCIYTLLGSIRSSAQFISYELSLSMLIVSVLIGDSYSLKQISDSQSIQFNITLYWPITIAYIISILAETNRAPFDLPEAESELVSGFNTEYSALPFAYFFLAEYSYLISQSVLFTYIFLGSYIIPFIYVPIYIAPVILFIKTSIVIYLFVQIRATIPRLRYDLLQYIAWNLILPIAICYLFINTVIIL